MKLNLTLALICAILVSCKTSDKPLIGTWKLLSGTLIETGDTTVTDYTQDKSFIKIINNTHFAFLLHNLKDSTGFSAGGGKYTLNGDTYTEHLEYCSSPNWEGHDFKFTVTFKGDTLVQSGTEIIPESNINRMNIEKYIKVRQ